MKWNTCLLLVGWAIAGCQQAAQPSPPPEPTAHPQSRPPVAPPTLPPPSGETTLPPRPASAVVVEKAPAGPVAELLVARRARLQPDQTLLVDVGAPWCEPCRRFHDAAAAGQLDADFPGLVLVEFDWDVDRDRLVAAGYDTQLIPLLAPPGVDGRGTPRRLSGSVKGPGALDNLRPRLRALLDGRPVE